MALALEVNGVTINFTKYDELEGQTHRTLKRNALILKDTIDAAVGKEFFAQNSHLQLLASAPPSSLRTWFIDVQTAVAHKLGHELTAASLGVPCIDESTDESATASPPPHVNDESDSEGDLEPVEFVSSPLSAQEPLGMGSSTRLWREDIVTAHEAHDAHDESAALRIDNMELRAENKLLRNEMDEMREALEASQASHKVKLDRMRAALIEAQTQLHEAQAGPVAPPSAPPAQPSSARATRPTGAKPWLADRAKAMRDAQCTATPSVEIYEPPQSRKVPIVRERVAPVVFEIDMGPRTGKPPARLGAKQRVGVTGAGGTKPPPRRVTPAGEVPLPTEGSPPPPSDLEQLHAIYDLKYAKHNKGAPPDPAERPLPKPADRPVPTSLPEVCDKGGCGCGDGAPLPMDPLEWIGALADDSTKARELKWHTNLSAECFRVMRMKGTEEIGTGEYNEHFADGAYACAACSQPLYQAAHKFKSGHGWPAFSESIDGALTRYGRIPAHTHYALHSNILNTRSCIPLS